MRLALDILGSLLWLALGAIGMFGVGLCVAFLEAAGAPTPLSDAQLRAKLGRGRALRRYALYWFALATICVILFLALAVSRGS